MASDASHTVTVANGCLVPNLLSSTSKETVQTLELVTPVDSLKHARYRQETVA